MRRYRNTTATRLTGNLQRELAFYLGPLASVLVKRASKQASSFAELCDLLAVHLANQHEREAFLAKTAQSFTKDTPSVPIEDEPAAATPVPDPDPAPFCDPRALRGVEASLAKQVGPVARILIRREQKQATDLDDLYERLAEHITGTEERNAFLEACKNIADS